jgi:hypothetical protein
MLLRRQSSLYSRDLPQIHLVDAENEPEANRLFAEPQGTPSTQIGYPHITLRTSVVYEGFTFDVVLNDMPLEEAAALLRRRGCTPATLVAPVATVEPTPVAPATLAPALAPDPLAPNTLPRGLSVYERREYRAEIYKARRIRGQWLKEQRKALGMPAKELAARVGVVPERISAYIAGEACPEHIWRAIENVLGRRYNATE